MPSRYGLIGKKLSHSFSRDYFAHKFAKEGLKDHTYLNLEIPSAEKLAALLSDTGFDGFNVTIPYKESVIPYLQAMDRLASEVGAVNTIKRLKDGSLKGFNTDVIGFDLSLNEFNLADDSRALILGSGGASKAVAQVLSQRKIPYLIISRNPKGKNSLSYAELNAQLIGEHRLIINCTPLGMYPKIDRAPQIPYSGFTEQHFAYDLIYRPEKSLFLQKAEAQGAVIKNGMQMLIAQAEAAWKIWKDPAI